MKIRPEKKMETSLRATAKGWCDGAKQSPFWMTHIKTSTNLSEVVCQN